MSNPTPAPAEALSREQLLNLLIQASEAAQNPGEEHAALAEQFMAVMTAPGTADLLRSVLAALAHAEALERERWIPVEERLPEMDVDVLVFDGRDTFIAYRTESGWEQAPNIYHQPHGITHWQTLPAPPAPASAEGASHE